MSESQRPARQPRPRIRLEVVRREQVTPHLVRVVLGGDGFDEVVPNAWTDAYVKLFLRDADGDEVKRTYTVRWIDAAARELALDVVVHGDEGVAGPWAARAEPGDPVELSGPGGAYAPDPTADAHVLVGDHAALPAIAAALEALPAGARGTAIVHVPDAADRQEIAHPAGVDVVWLHGDDPGAVVAELEALDWPQGRVHVFAHGERGSMKALRDAFARRGVRRADLSLSGYWALGRTEDRFQAEKREPIGVIEPVPEA